MPRRRLDKGLITHRLLLADLGFMLIIGWLLMATIDRFDTGQSVWLLPYVTTEDLGKVLPADSVLNISIGKPGFITVDSDTLFSYQVAGVVDAYVAKYGRTSDRAVAILTDSSSSYSDYIRVLDACKLARRNLTNEIAQKNGIKNYSPNSQLAHKQIVEREVKLLFMEYTAVLDTATNEDTQRIVMIGRLNDGW